MNTKRIHVHIERLTLRGVSADSVRGVEAAIRAHMTSASPNPSGSRRATADRIGAAVAAAINRKQSR